MKGFWGYRALGVKARVLLRAYRFVGFTARVVGVVRGLGLMVALGFGDLPFLLPGVGGVGLWDSFSGWKAPNTLPYMP